RAITTRPWTMDPVTVAPNGEQKDVLVNGLNILSTTLLMAFLSSDCGNEGLEKQAGSMTRRAPKLLNRPFTLPGASSARRTLVHTFIGLSGSAGAGLSPSTITQSLGIS